MTRTAASISWRPEANYIVASGSPPLGVPDDFDARVAAVAKSLGMRLVLGLLRGLPLHEDASAWRPARRHC
ncbi:MAG: hypothetical protein WB611_17690 [Stellaceae bacterium]